MLLSIALLLLAPNAHSQAQSSPGLKVTIRCRSPEEMASQLEIPSPPAAYFDAKTKALYIMNATCAVLGYEDESDGAIDLTIFRSVKGKFLAANVKLRFALAYMILDHELVHAENYFDFSSTPSKLEDLEKKYSEANDEMKNPAWLYASWSEVNAFTQQIADLNDLLRANCKNGAAFTPRWTNEQCALYEGEAMDTLEAGLKVNSLLVSGDIERGDLTRECEKIWTKDGCKGLVHFYYDLAKNPPARKKP